MPDTQHRNPPHAVKISLPQHVAQDCRELLDILICAKTVKPGFTAVSGDVNEITLIPPKYVMNTQFWAEYVVKYANSKGFPALAVRI
jgi:hypothetical protein